MVHQSSKDEDEYPSHHPNFFKKTTCKNGLIVKIGLLVSPGCEIFKRYSLGSPK